MTTPVPGRGTAPSGAPVRRSCRVIRPWPPAERSTSSSGTGSAGSSRTAKDSRTSCSCSGTRVRGRSGAAGSRTRIRPRSASRSVSTWSRPSVAGQGELQPPSRAVSGRQSGFSGVPRARSAIRIRLPLERPSAVAVTSSRPSAPSRTSSSGGGPSSVSASASVLSVSWPWSGRSVGAAAPGTSVSSAGCPPIRCRYSRAPPVVPSAPPPGPPRTW